MEATIGIIGGSGFYSLLQNAEEVNPDTKYGKPSGPITVGTISGRTVAFLPRHGTKHTIPPHKVPFRANIDALRSLGVKRIIATNAVGSLKEDYAPGELVFFDQYVNATHGRADTFYDEDVVAHVSMAEPYCSQMRNVAATTADKLKLKYHKSGSVVVVNGPRFSTKSESRMFSSHGFETINMTQYPEVALARERGICYLGIGMVTDYDVGLEGKDIKPVTADQVVKIFEANVGKTRDLIMNLIPEAPGERTCACGSSMDGAIQTKK